MTLAKPSQRLKQERFQGAKAVHECGILRRTLARKCKNKIENVAEKRPGSLPVLVDPADKDLLQ